jgi:hypothetical protein
MLNGERFSNRSPLTAFRKLSCFAPSKGLVPIPINFNEVEIEAIHLLNENESQDRIVPKIRMLEVAYDRAPEA